MMTIEQRITTSTLLPTAKLKFALIAGELSGDILAASLVSELRRAFPHSEFIGVCGDNMRRAGVRALADISALSIIGLLEIIKHLPRLIIFRRNLIKQLISEKPNFVIGVDAPDFNLALLTKLRKKGFATYQYVAPTVWAWRSWRIRKIKKAVSAVFCIFPFETKILQEHNIPAIFVGHPLAKQIPEEIDLIRQREEMKIAENKIIITLLPGSRESELHRHSEILINCAKLITNEICPTENIQTENDHEIIDGHHSERIFNQTPKHLQEILSDTKQTFITSPVEFLVPLASVTTYEIFSKYYNNYLATTRGNTKLPLRIMRGHSRRAIAVSNICITASGSASLEVALYKKPMVIFYKLNRITLLLSRLLYKLPWFGLPNILCRKFVVKEYLQNQATAQNLADECLHLIKSPTEQEIIKEEFQQLHQELLTAETDIWQNAFKND